MISNIARVDLNYLSTGMINQAEIQLCAEAMAKVGDCNLIIDDEGGLTIQEIKTKARRAMRELGGLSCIVIDYLGEMEAPERGMNDYERMTENTRKLKALAKELKIPIIVLAQLSRALETRADKRPILSDLRESGHIEQAADLVIFLYRDKYYNPDADNTAEVIIAKNRNGPKGIIKLAFHEAYTRFDPIAKGRDAA